MIRKIQKEETRKKVFGTALNLFAAKGFDNTTIEEITQKAKVAKGTFYTFFTKKEDILVHYLNDKIVQSHDRFMLNPDAPFLKQYQALISNYLKYIFRNKNFARILLKERIMSQGIINNPYESKVKTTIAQLVDLAKRQKEISKEVNTKTVVDVISGLNTLYIIYWVNGTLKNKEECVARICEAIELFLVGIKHQE